MSKLALFEIHIANIKKSTSYPTMHDFVKFGKPEQIWHATK